MFLFGLCFSFLRFLFPQLLLQFLLHAFTFFSVFFVRIISSNRRRKIVIRIAQNSQRFPFRSSISFCFSLFDGLHILLVSFFLLGLFFLNLFVLSLFLFSFFLFSFFLFSFFLFGLLLRGLLLLSFFLLSLFLLNLFLLSLFLLSLF